MSIKKADLGGKKTVGGSGVAGPNIWGGQNI